MDYSGLQDRILLQPYLQERPHLEKVEDKTNDYLQLNILNQYNR